MARINIEEKWFSDPRRIMLVSKLGNKRDADGVMVMAIKLAQQYWIPNRELIPIKSWKGCEMPDELFMVGLAELRNDDKFVYVSGSAEHFQWYFDKIEKFKQRASKAGKASVASRIEKYGSSIPINATNYVNFTQNTLKNLELRRTKPNYAEPSSSSSSSKKETTLSSGDDLHEIALIWNENCDALPKVLKMNNPRKVRCKQLWKENSDKVYWFNLIKALISNPWNTGRNDRGWIADFDYFLQEKVQIKLIESKPRIKKQLDFGNE